MQTFTPETLAKTNAAAKKATYLTVAELAEYCSRSVSWVNQQVRAGNIVPDAKLATGKRGRPANLFRKGSHTLAAKRLAKTAYAPRKAKVAAETEQVA